MLKTEERNPHSIHIDRMSTEEMLRLIQDENMNAVRAIESELERIAKATDAIAERMKMGGRLFYVGCGTSGRLGVLDASECPPTYGVPKDLVIGIIAGTDTALRSAVESAEDDRKAGFADIMSYRLMSQDSVVGISVAGGAAYVLGAIEAARSVGALTVGLSCNEGSPLDCLTDIGIHPDTGAEVITGSTRMKAGSAHKMILNMISTSVMVKLGHVYENLMINLRPSNIKLKKRMIGIVGRLTGATPEESEALLIENGYDIKSAVAARRAKDNND